MTHTQQAQLNQVRQTSARRGANCRRLVVPIAYCAVCDCYPHQQTHVYHMLVTQIASSPQTTQTQLFQLTQVRLTSARREADRRRVVVPIRCARVVFF